MAILPMILGSIYVTAGALIIGVPAGLLTAIYMAKFANKKIVKLLVPATELLAGIPSVVYGFFGLVVIVPTIRETFGGSGTSLLAASVLLGIMILPTIITVSRSALLAVPDSYYEGALALGATHERAVFRIDASGGEIRCDGSSYSGRWPGHRRGNGGDAWWRETGQLSPTVC